MSNRWLTRRAITLHLTLVVLLPAFGWLTWWQVTRALGGNTLSWAYSFEWPFFAGYAVYLWWWLIHDQGRDRDEDEVVAPAGAGEAAASAATAPEVPAGPGAGWDDEEDEELAAYNRYLAALNASGRRKRW